MPSFRSTSQPLPPLRHTPTPPGAYDIYPSHPAEGRAFLVGYDAIASWCAEAHDLRVDGYVGVLWDYVRSALEGAFERVGRQVRWISTDAFLHPEHQIDRDIAPFLGGDDPLWGTACDLDLSSFYDLDALTALEPSVGALTVLIGIGASSAPWSGPLLYLDVPKAEIQFRSRAGSVTNLGATAPASAKAMYKRFYFVDWPILNRRKKELLGEIDLYVDTQRPETPVAIVGDDLRSSLDRITTTSFRVRPWFEPGPWGGQWLKRHIPELPQDVPNYAWSFELIVPENGIMFEKESVLLECSFDLLMYRGAGRILGEAHDRFGDEFPIRFDYLDTVGGGNLSVQCHPHPDFIRRAFGERFTQDETYYIVACEADARVYLGFKEEGVEEEFRRELEGSAESGAEIEVERYVATLPASKGDLFLIPHGTIHCSGRGNLVLEISATPYIFTFKMYDWVRRDLDGNLRPLNIERAYRNLRFDRAGERVERELKSKPVEIARGQGWVVEHLPTHPDHFYDIRRITFDGSVEVLNEGRCHVLNLVDGSSISLESNGSLRRYNAHETFVVPAAAEGYLLRNEGSVPAVVVIAYVR